MWTLWLSSPQSEFPPPYSYILDLTRWSVPVFWLPEYIHNNVVLRLYWILQWCRQQFITPLSFIFLSCRSVSRNGVPDFSAGHQRNHWGKIFLCHWYHGSVPIHQRLSAIYPNMSLTDQCFHKFKRYFISSSWSWLKSQSVTICKLTFKTIDESRMEVTQ